jgi:transcriptional regulator with PAS, ATPase and Fis domain
VERELRRVSSELSASVAFVEACALRPWPGNVRELLREVTRAAHRALEAQSPVVEAEHLLEEAGAAMRPGASPGATRAGLSRWSDEEIRRALADNAGNVRATARALDVHRNQLRRWVEKHVPSAARDASGETLPPGDADD